jgi:flagellar biosynthesis regulator FlaF
MPKLYYLDIRNTEVTSISYDENGNSKSTLDILKAANARENKTIKNEDGSSTLVSQPLKYLYIKGTSLSEDEINNSGIRALTWSTFSY